MGRWYLRAPASMGCLWYECVCAVCLLASTKLNQPVARRPVGQVWGLGIRAGVLSREKHCASTEMIQERACAWESRECSMCACASDLLSPPVWRTGTSLSVLLFYVGPICKCCWRQHLVCGSLFELPCQCLLCMCACVCVFL